MRNARTYERKIKKLLDGMDRSMPAEAVDEKDAVEMLVDGVLQADASAAQAERALEAIREEFVDCNELRVSPTKEIVEAIGEDFPAAHRKANTLVKCLNGIFERANGLDVGYMEDMPKRELRRHLLGLGLDPFSAAYVVLFVFGGHAVPVDQTLVDCLEMDGYIYPGSDVQDVQGFLERIIPQKDGIAAHGLLRAYVARSARALAGKKKARAAAKAAAKAAKTRKKATGEKKRAKAKARPAAKKTASRKRKSPAKAKKKSAVRKSKSPKRATSRARKK